MYTIRARYDGKKFNPMQPIPVKENCEVLITFLEPEKKEPAKIPFSEMRGIFKGKIWMSDDFNEPLEELKEYME